MSPSEQERFFIEKIENVFSSICFYYFMRLVNEDSWMKTVKSVEIEVKNLLTCYLLFIYKNEIKIFNQFFR